MITFQIPTIIVGFILGVIAMIVFAIIMGNRSNGE